MRMVTYIAIRTPLKKFIRKGVNDDKLSNFCKSLNSFVRRYLPILATRGYG